MNTKSCSTLTKKYKETLDILHALYRVATSALTVRELTGGILRIIKNKFSASSASIILIYPNNSALIKASLKKHREYSFKKEKKKRFTKQEKEIFQTNKIVFSKRAMIIPLIFIKTVGIISITKTKKLEEFTVFDKELFKALSETISIIIRNFQIYEEQRKTILGAVKALNHFLRQYTPTSSINSDFLDKILNGLAKRMNLTENQTNALRYSALLHDTGKIDLPPDLLLKNTPLTEEDRELIRKHPQKGAYILRDLQAIRPVIPIILHHHEKYDGTGYPSGLKRGKIPLEARIMTIIDSFDAMIFGRPYKKKIDLESAINELRRNKGTQFDPKIAEAFISTLHTAEVKKYLKKKLKTV